MNERRFSELIKAYCENAYELFYERYGELLEYATYRSGKTEDIDLPHKAVSKLVGLISVCNQDYDRCMEKLKSWYYAKRIIDNYITDAKQGKGKGHIVVPVGDLSEDYEGMEGRYQEISGRVVEVKDIDKHGYPKCDPYSVPIGMEREICIRYWPLRGKVAREQHEIAKELGIDKGYVSRIIRRYKAHPKPDTRDSFTSGTHEES